MDDGGSIANLLDAGGEATPETQEWRRYNLMSILWGDSTPYEWQGRPPHGKAPWSPCPFLDSLYVVISPLACCCFLCCWS